MKDAMMQRVAATKGIDAFRIAMQMEKEGVEFYKKAEADAPTDKKVSLQKARQGRAAALRYFCQYVFFHVRYRQLVHVGRA